MQKDMTAKIRAFGTIVPALLIAAALALGVAALLAQANETNAATGIKYLLVDGTQADTDDLSVTVYELWSWTDFDGSDPNFVLDGSVGDGWFMVMDYIDLGWDSDLTIVGTVNLIIAADVTLVTDFGIIVPSGATLNLWTQDPASVSGTYVGVTNPWVGNGISLGDDSSFTNTTCIYSPNGIGVYAEGKADIRNGVDGIIDGTKGIHATAVAAGTVINNRGSIYGSNGQGIELTGTGSANVYNSGTIEGAYNGIYVQCPSVTITNYGTIEGGTSSATGNGISSNSAGTHVINGGLSSLIKGANSGVLFTGINGKVENEYMIQGGSRYGVESTYNSATILNNSTATIRGASGVYIKNFNDTTHSFINAGMIEGTSSNGIVLEDGTCTTNAITNNGTIKGNTTAVFIPSGTNMKVVNNGLITSDWSDGVYFGTHAANSTLANNAGNGTTTGLISAASGSGVNFAANGTLNNYGKISGDWGVKTNANVAIINYAGDGVNNGLITGTSYGVETNTGKVENYGKITGTAAGSIGISAVNALIFNTGNGSTTGVISGINIGVYQSNLFVDPPSVVFINDGLIEGGQYGVHVINGFFVAIDNNASAEIKGTGADGVGIRAMGTNILIKNKGGTIIGQATGIYLDVIGTVMNERDGANIGAITGTTGGGVELVGGGRVYNEGTITGGNYGVYSMDDTEVTNAGDGSALRGIITGTGAWGIFIDGGALVYNDNGTISGANGVYTGWLDKVSDQYIVNTGSIVGTSGHGIVVEDGLEVEIRNFGKIEALAWDKSGVSVNYGVSVFVINADTGEIIGDFGVTVWGGDDAIFVTNEGIIRTFAGGWTGAYILFGAVVNGGTIHGDAYGVGIGDGGSIYNGPGAKISCGMNKAIEGNGSILLEQFGLIEGDVYLENNAAAVHYVALGVGSKIDGDFWMGLNPASTLAFIGTLGASLQYAEITGDTDIGDKKIYVIFDVAGAGLPAGFAIGDKIILIDGSAGSIFTAPANATFTDDDMFFKIYIENHQLIAEYAIPTPPVHYYYIKASADGNTTISPAGTVTVAGGSNAKFTFSAVAGSFIGSVIVDGVYLSQADIDKGYYTFYDVRANHTIQVESRGARTGILLTVTVAEGKGYAEYSINGGNFTKYTSSVPIAEGSNVTLRAVADKGYEFAEWREGGIITHSAEVNYSNVTSNVEVSVSFFGEDSSSYSNNLLMYLLVIILVLLVIFILLYFFRKKSGPKGDRTRS